MIYPSRKQLRRAGVNKVATSKGITLDKARSLFNKLDGDQPATPPITCHTIKATARQILHLTDQIKAQQDYLAELFKEHPDVKLVESIKGIGLDSAVRLIVEIEDYSRFDSSKALCAYFGVHPTWRQSGDDKWKYEMSKLGRPEVRGILYMCGMSGIRWNPPLKQLYKRFRKKGIKHYQAMGVVMHKLLRMVYGVLKNQSAFDPQVDLDNQQQCQEKQKQYQRETARKKKILKTT